jgi:sugar lactone lactonase YvrE
LETLLEHYQFNQAKEVQKTNRFQLKRLPTLNCKTFIPKRRFTMKVRNSKFDFLALVFVLLAFFLASSANTTQAETQFLFQWGSLGTGDGQFNGTRYSAIDNLGNIYVGDVYNSRVQKFTSNGTYLAQWGSYGSDDGQFTYTYGIAADASGNIYIADLYNHRIQKFTSDGIFITKWGTFGSEEGQFNQPAGVAVDSLGNVYVNEYWNSRVQKFTSNGTFITKWGSSGSGDGQFNVPAGIAIDSSDNVYIGDQYNHRIQKFTSDGIFITKWGTFGSEEGQLYYPAGLAVYSDNIYVVDTFNDRVQVFTSNGTFITKWGSSGSGNGQLDHPQGIAINNSGYIYVMDDWNNRVEVFGSPVPVGPTKLWIGLKNSDDQGTQFDLKTELYVNGMPSSEGQILCATGVTRNPSNAKIVEVPSNPIEGLTFDPGDVVSLKISTRIGTNPDGTKCAGHNSAAGLRLYYDSASRPSKFEATISPDPTADYFLHSSGATFFLDAQSPTGSVKYKDSAGVNFNNGNPWKEIGTWSMQLQ